MDILYILFKKPVCRSNRCENTRTCTRKGQMVSQRPLPLYLPAGYHSYRCALQRVGYPHGIHPILAMTSWRQTIPLLFPSFGSRISSRIIELSHCIELHSLSRAVPSAKASGKTFTMQAPLGQAILWTMTDLRLILDSLVVDVCPHVVPCCPSIPPFLWSTSQDFGSLRPFLA